jgi:hypothetical protein
LLHAKARDEADSGSSWALDDKNQRLRQIVKRQPARKRSAWLSRTGDWQELH